MNTRPANLLATRAMLVLALASCGGDQSSSTDQARLFVVERGPLTVSVTEQGEIQAYRSTRVKSEMEGSATILFLVEEGKVVEKGEKLVELDASGLFERRANQGITLARAEASLVQARKNLEITRKQVEADNLASKNELKIAELEQEKFLGRLLPDETREMGEQQQELEQQQSEIKLAEENMKLAKDTMEWSDKLFQKGWITKNELERDQIGYQERQVRVKVARNQLEILERFSHVQKQLELQQGLREAQIKVEQTIARGEATMAQANAEVKSSEAEYDLAKERYENIENQIKNATMYAPTDGLVVYSSEGGNRGRSQEFVEEGAQARERQTLIVLPDISRMTAELKIHEAFVDKVEVGQFARIKVDAFDQGFTGTVRRVSPVADSGSRWGSSDVKLYKTSVDVDGENTLLRPGMTAEVKIIIAELEDVLSVPLHTVRRQGAVPFVWLDTPTGPEARQVQLGISNYNFVVVESGLEEGDRIYQAAPDGIKQPEFEQPEVAARPAPARRTGAGTAEATHSEDGSDAQKAAPANRERRGGGDRAATLKKFTDLAKQKLPQFADRFEGMGWFRDEEITDAIQADDELRELMEEMRAGMRRGGGRRAGGEGGEGRTRRGGADEGKGRQGRGSREGK